MNKPYDLTEMYQMRTLQAILDIGADEEEIKRLSNRRDASSKKKVSDLRARISLNKYNIESNRSIIKTLKEAALERQESKSVSQPVQWKPKHQEYYKEITDSELSLSSREEPVGWVKRLAREFVTVDNGFYVAAIASLLVHYFHSEEEAKKVALQLSMGCRNAHEFVELIGNVWNWVNHSEDYQENPLEKFRWKQLKQVHDELKHQK